MLKKRFLRIAAVFLTLIITAVTALAVLPARKVKAAAVTPKAVNIYYIKNKNSGMYLTVQGDSSSSGANVIQSKGTGSLGQRWILEANSNGTYRLHPATDMTGGISLDVANGSANNNTNIQIWGNNGYSAQNFSLKSSSDGYAITTAVSNGASCLDVAGASTATGANVIEYTYKGSANQIWYFEEAQWPSSGSGSSSSGSGSSGSGSSSSGSTSVAIDSVYSQQRLQFVNTNDNSFLTAPSSTGNTKTSTASSTYNQWVLENNGSNKYMIVNAATGYVLAPSGNTANSGSSVVATGKTGSTAQYWTISAVTTDANNNGYAYKISNCANTNLCLQKSGQGFILGSYKGNSTHKFYINSYGVEGFAGKCKSVDGKETASVLGGALGKTVYVSNVSDLQSYCSGSTPYTIVINGNISATNLTKVNVGSNKTIIGSFNANTLNNIHFRCISNSGNVIFKNLTLKHDADKNANDDIQMYISNGTKFWVDHCTFPGHTINKSDVDKHMYVGLKADYVTVSANVFMNHKYSLILGYPAEDGMSTYKGYPQMTICNNYFYNCETRAPGLMRYGYYHVYNNFVYSFNLGFTPYTGSTIYSEKNYFDKGAYAGWVIDDYGVGNFTDNGSVLSSSLSGIKTAQTSWRPITSYSYATRNAADAKAWAQANAGVQKSTLHYAID